MKKALLFLAFIASAVSYSFAQPLIPTITAVTNNPVIGDMFIGHIADTTGISMGASGANILWDFSMLQTNAMDTSAYVACAATPRCDSFPGSNIVLFGNNNRTYNYLNQGSSKLRSLGRYDTGAACVFLTDPQTVLFYPFSYTSNYRDTFCYMPSSGGTDSFICDAYGTLILPSATYGNTLRVHVTTVYRDTVSVTVPPVISERRVETYSWYDSGYHSPLLTITYDTLNTSVPYITHIEYYTSFSRLAVNSIINRQINFEVFPNPVTDIMSVKFNIPNNTGAFITITDVMGRTVRTISSDHIRTGANQLDLPVNGLPDGTYAVRLHTTEGNAVKTMVIFR